MTKQKPQVGITKPLDPNHIFDKVDGHPALAPIDLLTIRQDLSSVEFVYLYKLPVLKIESKTLATAINGCKGRVDKNWEVELNCGCYAETSMFYVTHLSGWDMIDAKLALQDVLATISAGTASGTIQPRGMDRSYLRMWRGNPVTDQKSDLTTAANYNLA